MLGEGVTKEVNSQMKEQGKNLQQKRTLLKKQVGSLYFKKKMEALKLSHDMNRHEKQAFVKMVLEKH